MTFHMESIHYISSQKTTYQDITNIQLNTIYEHEVSCKPTYINKTRVWECLKDGIKVSPVQSSSIEQSSCQFRIHRFFPKMKWPMVHVHYINELYFSNTFCQLSSSTSSNLKSRNIVQSMFFIKPILLLHDQNSQDLPFFGYTHKSKSSLTF